MSSLVLAALAVVTPVMQHDQQLLNEMAINCGLPEGTAEILAEGFVRLRVLPDAKFEAVDCLIERLRKSKFRTKLGFVGNEYYQPPESDK